MKNKNIIRSVLRRAMPATVYRFFSVLLNIFEIIRKYGLKTLLELYFPETKDDNFATVTLGDFNYPFFFRPGTTDTDTIIQNIIREEYGYLPDDIEPAWIIDAGGYIGDVAVYFAKRFKNCRIITIEPDPDNFAVAKRNIEPYSNRITLINKGLWSHPAVLELCGSLTGANTCTMRGGKQKRKIEAIGIDRLMQAYNIDHIDILKMDIEGAEKKVLLNGSDAWLHKTKALIVEFHDRRSLKPCCSMLQSRGFSCFEYRSLHYFFH